MVRASASRRTAASIEGLQRAENRHLRSATFRRQSRTLAQSSVMLYRVPRRADTSWMDAPQLKSAWLLPPVILGLYLLHTAWSWALAGAIALVVGTLVALDYRGVAKRIPWVLARSHLGWSRSVGARRRAFGALAVWGVLMLLLSLR